MKKFIIVAVSQTDGMEGYSAIVIPVTAENLNKLEVLRENINEVKQINPNINAIQLISCDFDYTLLNDDFEVLSDAPSIEEIDMDLFKNYLEDRDCRVDSPCITVKAHGININFPSKWADGNVYIDIDFEVIDNLIENNQ